MMDLAQAQAQVKFKTRPSSIMSGLDGLEYEDFFYADISSPFGPCGSLGAHKPRIVDGIGSTLVHVFFNTLWYS